MRTKRGDGTVHPEVNEAALRAGAVGELALLAGDPARAASARARRDCEVLEVPQARFEALLVDRPQLALALVRNLANVLRASRVSGPRPRPARATAIVALHPGAPAQEVTARLLVELRRYGTVTELAGIAAVDLPEALDRAERDHERIILTAPAPDSVTDDEAQRAWTAACLGLADRIVGVRTMLVGARDTSASARRHADLVITPAVEDILLLRFDQLDRAIEAGRQAAREALANEPAFIEGFG